MWRTYQANRPTTDLASIGAAMLPKGAPTESGVRPNWTVQEPRMPLWESDAIAEGEVFEPRGQHDRHSRGRLGEQVPPILVPTPNADVHTGPVDTRVPGPRNRVGVRSPIFMRDEGCSRNVVSGNDERTGRRDVVGLFRQAHEYEPLSIRARRLLRVRAEWVVHIGGCSSRFDLHLDRGAREVFGMHGGDVRPREPIARQRGTPTLPNEHRTHPVFPSGLRHLVVGHQCFPSTWMGLSATQGRYVRDSHFPIASGHELGYETRALGIADRMGRCTDRRDPL